jgi:hypothetical protein
MIVSGGVLMRHSEISNEIHAQSTGKEEHPTRLYFSQAGEYSGDSHDCLQRRKEVKDHRIPLSSEWVQRRPMSKVPL